MKKLLLIFFLESLYWLLVCPVAQTDTIILHYIL